MNNSLKPDNLELEKFFNSIEINIKRDSLELEKFFNSIETNIKRYILKNKIPVLEPDFLKANKFHRNIKNRTVKVDTFKFLKDNVLKEEFTVSTVFLCIDHNYSDHGKPILFETMIFSDITNECMDYQDRYCTWEEAEQGHKKAISFLEKKYNFKDKTK